MENNFMQDKEVKRYFNFWMLQPTLLEHSEDKEYFYKFVKACVEHAKRNKLSKIINTDILKQYIGEALRKRSPQITDEGLDKIRQEIVALFDILINYENTKLP